MYQIDLTLSRAFVSTVKSSGMLRRRISNLADVNQAVYDVYNAPSVIARRMPGRAALSVAMLPILDHIADEIHAYFNATPNTVNAQSTFDAFHARLCNWFMAKYNSIASHNSIATIEYGIAQKLINVTFKYLSCYADYATYSDLFEHCHMPIDSYVLYYFALHSIVPGCKGRFPLSSPNPYACYRAPSASVASCWTKLTAKEYEQLVIAYRSELARLYPDYTMLHLEYYIWNSIKTHSGAPIAPAPTTPLPGTKTSFYM